MRGPHPPMSCDVLFTESSPRLGGQELQLLQQMAALQDRGIGTALACRPGSAIDALAEARGLRRLLLPLRSAGDLSSLSSLRRFLAAEGTRCVIGHSGHDANLGLLAAWSLARRPRLLRSKTYVAGRASALTHSRLVDATLVPSAYLREQLLASPGLDGRRVKVLYPGIDFDRLDADAVRPLPPDLAAFLGEGAGPLVVQVGMLRGEKGHALLVPALVEASRRHPGLRYVAAGDGPERPAIEHALQAAGLAGRVWLGELRPVAPLLVRADLLVMPSTYEPLGMAQIEALGLGVPVLASRTGGIVETIADGRTGVLVTPGDREAWTAALLDALDRPAAARAMAALGREDVRGRFSLAANTEALRVHCGLAERSA